MNWFKENQKDFSGDLLFQEPLSRHTYYRIGGPAQILATPKGLNDLKWLARGLAETALSHFVLGSGSNILVSDEGFAGLVIKTQKLNSEISLDGSVLKTGASVAVSSLLRQAAQAGWGGLELLTGIPGSIGGVVAMNAGTHLGEAKDRLFGVQAYLLDRGVMKSFLGDELKFSYRKNSFLPTNAIVWSAEWNVTLTDAATVKSLIDETLTRRKSTQPLDYPSCGSVFKNPREKNMHAWQVIEKLGLRGHQIGKAQISEKHPNFIVNLGGASARDVCALISLVKSRAEAELGISLEKEVKFLGKIT